MTTALPHGYDVSRVERMAWRCAWMHPTGVLRPVERMDIGRHAIIVALHEAAEEPDVHALFSAAGCAISVAVQKEIRERGYSPKLHTPVRGFYAYWNGPKPTRDEMEDRIIEPLAVRQIMPLLHPSHRLALRLLADYGNRRDAAEAAGWTVNTLTHYLVEARREFADWWYWPDPPAPLWHPGRPGMRRGNYSTKTALANMRHDRGRTHRKEHAA